MLGLGLSLEMCQAVQGPAVIPPRVWAGVQAVAEMARADAGLSHCNPITRAASAAYSISIAHLVAHPGDAEGAVAAASAWATAHAGQGERACCVRCPSIPGDGCRSHKQCIAVQFQAPKQMRFPGMEWCVRAFP